MVKVKPEEQSLQSIMDAEEILRAELGQIKAEEELAKEKVHQLRLKELSRNEACCEDVCNTLNRIIDTRKKNIEKLKTAAQADPHSTMHNMLIREANIGEKKIKELEDFRDELYGRSTCDCRR